MKTLARIRELISEAVYIPLGNLGVLRHHMPQINPKDVPEFLRLLKIRGVRVEERQIRSNTLKATQKEINQDHVQDKIRKLKSGEPAKRCLVSSDNYILDGHHVWLAQLNMNRQSKIDCFWIDLKIEDLLNTAKLFDKVTYKTVNEVKNV